MKSFMQITGNTLGAVILFGGLWLALAVLT